MQTDAPQDLEALKKRYLEIIEGRRPGRFGHHSLRILKKMLENPDESAIQNISKTARANQTTASTITRMAQRLGYEGFNGLQAVFRRYVTQSRGYYSDQVKSMLGSECSTSGNYSPMESVTHEELANITTTLRSIDQHQIDGASTLITESQRIYVIGLRSAFSIAYYFAYYLGMLRDRVSLLAKVGNTLAEELASIHKGDLLIAFSFMSYTRETVDVCRWVYEQNVDILAITDLPTSPLASFSDHVLLASAKGPFPFDPIASSVLLVEILLSNLVHKMGAETVQRLKKIEAIFERLGVEEVQ